MTDKSQPPVPLGFKLYEGGPHASPLWSDARGGLYQKIESTTGRYTLTDANESAGQAGMVWFDRGIKEGYRKVLASSRTMTRDMLILWLEAEIDAE